MLNDVGFKKLLLLIFLVGLGLRLPSLVFPKSVVFDEVYFGKFATAYCCSHDNTFDIHPPHAKLLIAATAKAFGHKAGFGFERLGEVYPGSVSIFGLRLASAVFGILLACMATVLIFQLSGSVMAAFIGGMMLTWDNGFWVQSRIIALDPILIFFIVATLVTTIHALRQVDMRRRIPWLWGAGGCAAMAVGSKFTGMACLPIIGALLFLESWTSQRRDRWLILMRQSIWIVSGFTIIYLAGWWIHFALLTKVGAGDSFYVPKGRFFYDLVELHRIMLVKNAEISTQHAYGSKWYTWPLMTRPVFYWSSARGVIYLLGNPVVWYGILAGFVVALTVFFGQLFGYLREARKNWQDVAAKLGQAFNGFFASWVALAMCVTSFVPLMQVSRPLFIYHYFPTLLFIVVFTCSALVGVTSKLVAKWPRLLYLRPILLTLVIAGFVAMLPFTSGAPVGLKYRTTVYLWMPSWR